MKELRYHKNITEKTPVKIQFSTGKLLCVFALRLTVMELETSENDEWGIVWDFSTEVLGFQLGIFGLTERPKQHGQPGLADSAQAFLCSIYIIYYLCGKVIKAFLQ